MGTTRNSTSNPYVDKARLAVVLELAQDRVSELLDHLNIRYYVHGNEIRGPCPVHLGDNASAFSILNCGQWRCFTQGCHKLDKWGPDLLALARAVLSEGNFDKRVEWRTTVDFVCDFLGVKFLELDASHVDLQKAAFVKSVARIHKQRTYNYTGITRDGVRSRLQIPAEYYLGRGFSHKILDRFDVGFCTQSNKQMTGRVVVPVYDDKHEYLVGCSGRNTSPRCDKCALYHSANQKCPQTDAEIYGASKWVHSKNFRASSYLYNYWNAKGPILSSGYAILVEGPGDVWRLEEAGIRCGVAMFGTTLNDEQSIILEQSGALSLIVLTDNDKAGLDAAELIREQCGRLYRLYFPMLKEHDVGDTPTKDIKHMLKVIDDYVTR